MTYKQPWESVKAFVFDRLAHEPGSVVPKAVLYREFIEYCKEKMLPTVSKVTFGRILQGGVPRTRSERRYVDKRQARCWVDIAFKTNKPRQDAKNRHPPLNTKRDLPKN